MGFQTQHRTFRIIYLVRHEVGRRSRDISNNNGYTNLTSAVYSTARMRDIASDGVNHKECVMVIGGGAEDLREFEARSPSLSTEDVLSLSLSGIATITGDK